MTRIGSRRHVPLCFCCCCLLRASPASLPASDIFTQNRQKRQDRNGACPRNESALERSPYCLGGAFFGTEFQVWRGRIPEKSSKNTRFPLGGDCLEHRDRPPQAFGRISDQPTLITKFCTRTGLAQEMTSTIKINVNEGELNMKVTVEMKVGWDWNQNKMRIAMNMGMGMGMDMEMGNGNGK